MAKILYYYKVYHLYLVNKSDSGGNIKLSYLTSALLLEYFNLIQEINPHYFDSLNSFDAV